MSQLVPTFGRRRTRRRGLGLLEGDPPLVGDSDAAGTTADATQVDRTGVDITGENRLLLAGVAIPDGPAEADAVTLDPGGGNETPLVYLAEALAPNGTKMEVWALLAPPLGTNFTLRAESLTATSMVLGFLALDDVRQLNTYADVAIATALGAASISGTVSARRTDICIGFCAVEGTAVVTLDEDQASRYNAVSSGGSKDVRGRSGSRPGAGTSGAQNTTLTYTPDAPSDLALVVLAVRGTQGPTPGATLLRTTEGLMARYVYNEPGAGFALSDWEAQSSVNNLQIEGTGELRSSGTSQSSWHFVRHVSSPSRSKRMVQVVSRTLQNLVGQLWMGCGGHFEAGASGDQVSGGQFSVARSPEDHRALQRTGGTTDVSANATVTAKSAGTPYRQSAFVNGTSIVSYDFNANDLRGVTGTRSEGWAGIFANDTDGALRREFYDCTDRFLRVSGLPTGWKAKAVDDGDTVLAQATESGGAAQVDLLQVSLAAVAAVIITDGADAEQARFTPASGEKQVAGGDTYSYAA